MTTDVDDHHLPLPFSLLIYDDSRPKQPLSCPPLTMSEQDGGSGVRKRSRFDSMEPGAAGRKQRIDLSGMAPAPTSGVGGVGGNVNPYTGQAYSQRYHDILNKRKNLPVYQFLDELLDKIKQNQVGDDDDNDDDDDDDGGHHPTPLNTIARLKQCLLLL